jgi:hypothetical protein
MNEISTEAPAPPAAPVSERERLKLIDALRGVALLGILLMNIPGFAMPDHYSESFKSDPTNVNFWVSAVMNKHLENMYRLTGLMREAPGPVGFKPGPRYQVTPVPRDK